LAGVGQCRLSRFSEEIRRSCSQLCLRALPIFDEFVSKRLAEPAAVTGCPTAKVSADATNSEGSRQKEY
jgi:hypothetical protein